MSHEIFLSYSSKHRELTRQLAAAIEAQYGAGSVWWDHALEARGPYATQIRAALDAARVVVVLWSAGAQVSEWVYAEAQLAHAAGKLVNVRPADTPFAQIPAPFNIHHVEDGAATERILHAVAGVMAGRPVASAVPLHELYFRQHGHRLVDAKQSALPAEALDISPSQLLQARYEQVGYVDATGQRAALHDWALNHPRRAAGRLLHAPGGVGKTRLLIDLAAQLRRDPGWMAGFVEPLPAQADDAQRRQRSQALQQLVELGEEPGLLLVLDYAEGRQAELLELAAWIEARPEPARRPVRLVLLARSAGEWWQRLADEQPHLQRLWRTHPAWPPVLELPPFGSPEHRLALFDASVAAYRPTLAAQGLSGPAGAPPPALRQRIERGDRRSRPLSIQMEALVWLAGAAQSSEAPGVAELLDQVLGLERRHWRKALGPLDEAAVVEIERGLAQLTLVQGVPSGSAAEALLARDGYFQGAREAPVQMAALRGRLRRLYSDGGDGLRALEPDLLGEHLVGRVADERLVEACIAWVDAEADRVANDASLRRARLTTLLQRATAPDHGARSAARVAQLMDHLLGRHLARWAPAVVSAIVGTQGALLQRLQAHIAGLDATTLDALDAALPMRSLALDTVALEVAQRRLDLERKVTTDSSGDLEHLARLAACWGTLGTRLSAVGRREDALAASERSVQIYRGLAGARRDDFLPGLATNLNNLGNTLSDLGHHEDALEATDEAVQVYRGLAHDQPSAYLPGLAMSLNNRGNRLSDLGHLEEALVATDEAVQLYRSLAQDRPDAFLVDLASSLNNRGITLSGLGRREDALTATDEAVQLYRGLAQERPDAFLPDLAMSLNNRGNILSSLGRHDDALAATEEAVQLYRGLARDRPDAFLPDLAMSLNNLGAMLSDLGRREDALAAAHEAVQVYRGLAQARPGAFLPDLAGSLNNLGNRLSALGRRDEALVATDEAVKIRRSLAQDRPDAFLPDLASSLNNRGTMLSELGRRDDALAATDEAVQLYRDLAQARPNAFLPDLAMSLNNRGLRLSELGRREDALATTDEAVQAYRSLAQDRPDAFLPDLASSLNNRGLSLLALGRLEDALAATDEAVQLYRDLAQDRPDAFLPDLAMSLNNRGTVLSDLGRREDALAASDEAVQHYRELAQARPDAFLPDLAMSLGARSMALAAAGRHAEAALSTEEGLSALLPLLRRYAGAFGPLARSLVQAHLQHAKAATREPHGALLAEVAQILGLDAAGEAEIASPH